MLDQIERLLVGMKEVTDNIAHDLRSPIGRLQKPPGGDVAGGRRRKGLPPAPLRRPSRTRMRMLKTFTALLNIAQAEAGAPRRRQFAPVDLGAVVRDVSELYEPLAEERGLALIARGVGASASLPGDRNLLFQALANLADNAIKFSGPAERVAVIDRRWCRTAAPPRLRRRRQRARYPERGARARLRALLPARGESQHAGQRSRPRSGRGQRPACTAARCASRTTRPDCAPCLSLPLEPGRYARAAGEGPQHWWRAAFRRRPLRLYKARFMCMIARQPYPREAVWTFGKP